MSNKSDTKIFIIGGIICLFVVVAWVVTPWFLTNVFNISQLNDRGVFGDMFGSINALFSGLAFVGVIVAILLQKEELEEQRSELKLTREAFEEQNKVLNIQRFENTFFQMVSLHNEIVNTMSLPMRYPNPAKSYHHGREVFIEIYNHLLEKWNKERNENDIKIIFTEICVQKFSGVSGHYYRNMFRILRLIDSSGLPNELFYSKILHAQLSDNELILLYYNCFFYDRGKEFRKYAIKYKLFENFTGSELLDRKHLDELKNYKEEIGSIE
ncbi:MAG TPA: hypothetical protein DEA55_04885 [Rhodospirillaceae bacterium]|nr:hypothetical protein [Rhodospirillaceae bacterium]